MKNYLLILVYCFAVIFANAQSANELNNKISKTVAQIDSIRNADSDSKSESILGANKQLAQNIIAYAEATPGFIAQNVKGNPLNTDFFFSTISEDKKLRIVWWDDQGGGTTRNYDYIVFWNAGGKFNHKTFVSNIEGTDAAHIYYTYIDSVIHLKQQSGDDLYFVMGATSDGRFSYNQHIFCYKITASGEFTNDALVFKAGSKMLSQIDVDCPSYHDENGDVGFYQLLHFSKDKQVLYVPIFPDWQSQREKDTERADTTGTRKFSYFNYQFDGTNFVYTHKNNQD